MFNWVFIFQFDHSPHVPGLDFMAIVIPPIFYLMGFMDIIMLGWMKKERKIVWFYGIFMSIVVLLVAPVMFQSLAFWPFAEYFSSKLLFAIIVVFAGAEIISLVIPSARRYYRL